MVIYELCQLGPMCDNKKDEEFEGGISDKSGFHTCWSRNHRSIIISIDTIIKIISIDIIIIINLSLDGAWYLSLKYIWTILLYVSIRVWFVHIETYGNGPNAL